MMRFRLHSLFTTTSLTVKLDNGSHKGVIFRAACMTAACTAAGGLRVARRSISERNATLSKLERVPKDPPPAEESVRQIVSTATACENPRHRNEVVTPAAPVMKGPPMSHTSLCGTVICGPRAVCGPIPCPEGLSADLTLGCFRKGC